MNYRTIAASLLTLGVLATGALAGSNDYIVGTGPGFSDAEQSFAIGRDAVAAPAAVVEAQGLAASVSNLNVGDFIDETREESNQRSSN